MMEIDKLIEQLRNAGRKMILERWKEALSHVGD